MRLILGTVLLLLMLPSGIALAQENTHNTHQYQLKNGLQVIVREDHRSKVAMSMLWYRIGGSYEPLGVTGISHVLEHMMFQGTQQVGPEQFSQIMTRYGAQENAFTTRDYTGYYEMLDADYLPLSFALEADRMQHLSLSAQSFKKELQVVKEERRMRTDNQPGALLYERFQAMAHIGSPYANPVVGWPADLNHITVEDVKHWYQQWYAPNNATLVVVGDVHADDVFQLAQRYFGAIPAKKQPKTKPAEQIVAPGLRTLDMSSEQAGLPILIMGFSAPSLAVDKTSWKPYALQVLSAILDGNDSARLPQQLVRTQQVADSVSTSYDPFSLHNGLFMFIGVPNQEKGHTLEQLQSAVLAQVESIANHPPSEAEMQRVKTQLKASLVYGRDSLVEQAQEIGQMASVGLSWKLLGNALNQKLAQVTPEQVQQVAQEYFVKEAMTVARLRPKKPS